MTLIVNIDTPERIIQVSDRRFSVIRKDGAIVDIDDQANKAIVVTCPQAQFGVMFAGLAVFAGIPRTGLADVPMGLRTDHVIACCFQNLLDEIGFSPDIFNVFSSVIGRKYKEASLPSSYPLTIICHWFAFDRLFAARISNYNTVSARQPTRFCCEVDQRQPLKRRKKIRACRINCEGDGCKTFERIFIPHVRTLNRKGYFSRAGDHHIVRRIVEAVQVTSDRINTVGKNCMSTVLFRRPVQESEFICTYHPYGSPGRWYRPLIVSTHASPPPPRLEVLIR